jgi:hypothetical protein
MTDKLENKVDSTFYRSEIEKQYGVLTDKQWEVVAGEIESMSSFYVWNHIGDFILDDLADAVAEDEKYD